MHTALWRAARRRHRSRAAVALVGGILLLLVQGATASADPLPAAPASLGAPVLIEPLRPQGTLTVEVQRAGTWTPVRTIKADKHLRVQAVTVPVSAPGPLAVRITRRSGGAAHLDSVLLDGTPPRAAEGVALDKVRGRDLDLAGLGTTPVRLVFSAPEGDRARLEVTARVEAEVISETAFHYPLANLYRPITRDSAFYRYRLGSRPGRLEPDGDLAGEGLGAPFFSVYYPVGSGHPQQPVHAWVRDDGDKLYVALDVLSDNTTDPGVDYARVHVNAPGGVQTYEASAGEARWGRSGFGPTARADYGHKRYEFAIPLAELREAGRDGVLGLAFAVYGTSSPVGTQVNPDVAYSPSCDRFLAAYEETFSIGGISYDNIQARFHDPGGAQAGAPFAIMSGEDYAALPAVAHDTVNNRHLVVWQQGGDIHGQLVAGDGTLIGGNFIISDQADVQQNPRVAFEPNSRRYLVVWRDRRNADDDIYGQLVSAEGDLLEAGTGNVTTDTATNAPISQATATQADPDVVADPLDARFLVVWEDWRNNATSTDHDIFGQFVTANATASGGEIQISASATASDEDEPRAAFDPHNQRFLVVWLDDRGGLWSQLLLAGGGLFDQSGNGSGVPGEDELQVVTSVSGSSDVHDVAYDPDNHTYRVAYRQFTDNPFIAAQTVGEDGQPQGGEATVLSGDLVDPELASRLGQGGFLVVAQDTATSPDSVVAKAVAGVAAALNAVPGWSWPVLLGLVAPWGAATVRARRDPRWRRPARLLLLAVLLAALALGAVAACGGSSGGDGTTTTVTCP